MNPNWKELNVLCDLSHLGLLVVRGADAESFLQGQLTCDVRQVSYEHSLLGAHCSPKGRILNLFRLFRRDDAVFMRLPRESLTPALKRLRLYVLRSRAQIDDAGETPVRIGAAGFEVEARLQETLGLIPAKVDNAVQVQGLTLIRTPGVQPRFEIYGEASDLESLSQALAGESVKKAGRECWELLNVLAGTPEIYPQTTDAFLPQMLNLQLLDGVSFKKGCYTGQEIVARTQHLGKLKRRMYRAHVDTALAPLPGDVLFSSQAGPGENTGRIVASAPHPNGGHEVLAVVLIACAEAAPVRLGDADGPLLDFKPLPYAFEDAVS